MTDVLLHLTGIAHGLAACAAFALCFHVAGSLLIPRRWDERLGRDETPALIGAAVYMALCWFGVELGVAGKYVAAGFTTSVVLVALARYRWMAAALRAGGSFSESSRWWWGGFVLLYLIAYIYTMPPVGSEYLPIAWTGNIDLLTYLRYTRHLWDLGQSNLVGFEYLNFVYLQTPGLFYLLGWFSMLFGFQPLSAAMPAQFALTALIGLIAARMSHSIFGVRRPAALAIGCICIGTPLMRYVIGAYFLSTLMTTPVFLYLVWTTVAYRPSRFVDLPLAIRFGSAYVLLFFIYPFLLFAGLAAQLGALSLLSIAKMQEGAGARRDALRQAGATAAAAALSAGLLTACFFERMEWSWDMVTGLSKVGVAGWPLEVLSPLAVFGFPGVRSDGIQVETPELRIFAIAAFLAGALVLGYLYFWRFRHAATAPQKALVALLGGGIAAYCIYYLRVGPSYQQWKFATYAILPLSFVPFAAVMRVAEELRRPHVVRAVLATCAAVLIVGNLFVHARYDAPLFRIPGALWNLEQVDKLPFFREITVQMRGSNHLFSTYMALYFLQSKRLHVVSDVFEPHEHLSFETISRIRPLLIHDYGCEGVGHDAAMTIPDVGCLILSPPSPAPDVAYPFNRSFLFVAFDRMTAREPGGRWNTEPVLNVRISADPERAGVAQDAYVNLSLNPFLPEDMKPLRLTLTWGQGQRGEIAVRDQEWISLPVRSVDWSGDRWWMLPISIAFSDGRTVLFHALSISHVPRGRIVAAPQ